MTPPRCKLGPPDGPGKQARPCWRLRPTGRRGTPVLSRRCPREGQCAPASDAIGGRVGPAPPPTAGLPLTAIVTAANLADTTVLAAVVDDVAPIATPSGRRPTWPAALHADKGYDSQANRV